MKSLIKKLGSCVNLPNFNGVRLYMHPIDLSKPISLPKGFENWLNTIEEMLSYSPTKNGIAYVTIDQKSINKGETHRRGGAHTDGNYLFGWSGGGGWLTGTEGRILTEDKHNLQYNSETGGMLIVSDFEACKAWNGELEGIPNQGGCCEHLRNQFDNMEEITLSKNDIFWMNSTAIHESLPLNIDYNRTLLRITLPADSPNI